MTARCGRWSSPYSRTRGSPNGRSSPCSTSTSRSEQPTTIQQTNQTVPTMEETDMARTNSITQNRIDPTRPFFAAVGTVDYAVHVARTAQTRLRPKALVGTVGETVDDLNKQYVDLAARG